MGGFRPARWGGRVPAGEAVEHPADGTLSPEIQGDGSGETLPPVEVDATEAAQKLAADHGIDLTTVKGTGADDRITQPDVQAVIDQRSSD